MFDKTKWYESPEWERMSNRCQIDMLNTYLKVLESEDLLHRKTDESGDWDIDSYVSSGYLKLFDGNEQYD